ncbi:FAD-binding oxidoreductase [Brevundimonas sp.]|uniref:NAD(P)/FAD-dependent oxidoreductase n=1 Tax=Brevundimonas sp. TaxID=1871086 RepID=UPI001AC793D4|nr:FAD-binding oxidoreductase [Brevundimonas sp.]MBN9464017.1 FAD-binding oxidoreductase [Brevundimonas sp.]
MVSSKPFDVIVIGAGIAGAGVAAELSATHRVLLLEQESEPGRHATGRSAALYSAIYGGDQIRALTQASRAFFHSPHDDFTSARLLQPRGSLHIATEAQAPDLIRFAGLEDVAPLTRQLGPAEAEALCPILRPGHVALALYEPEAADIEVDLLHAGYLRGFKANGGQLVCDQAVIGGERRAGLWRIRTTSQTVEAPVIVNAAGAWADEIAALLGAQSIGLQPKRRTAVLVNAPSDARIQSWPLVIDAGEEFYFKPDAGLLLLSPGDETDSPPCDAQPEELDIATAVYRVEQATTLQVETVRHRWAGLRSFVPDRQPVVGYASEVKGFFWLAGQGGYGIQTAPALSRAAAALVKETTLPSDLLEHGVSQTALSPSRTVIL